jgi:type VI secretion system protein ImpC
MATTETMTETPLIAEVLGFTRIAEQDESYPVVKQGVEALLQEALKKDDSAVRVDKSFVNDLIDELDAR